MKPPEEQRKHLYKKAQERPFQFPRAVAWVFAIAYEPRQEPSGYPEALEIQLRSIRQRLQQFISEAGEDTNSLRNLAGELEKTCRDHIKQLRETANDHGLHDVIAHLDNAIAVSNGRCSPPPLREKEPVRFRCLPKPQVVKSGRPPVGYWR